nr:DEAD/DEAH box helicase family protein [Methanothermus fervidus]
MVSKEIIENFPYKKPRKEQLELIDKIYEAFESYDYVVLEAGTGIGKSGIAATLAKIYNSAYILTMTKQLQKQYFHDFRFPIVKGRNNFKCKINKNLTCDEGPCRILKLNCPHDPLDKKELDNLKSELNTSDAKKIQMYMDGDICDYRKQVYIGYISNITILNYQYAIMAFNYTRFFDKRYLMVFDEAHNIEDIVMKHVSYTLNNQLLYKDIGERLPNYKNLEKWIDYIAYILEKYKKRLKKLKKQIKNNQNDELLRKTVRMEKRIKKLEILNKNH